MFWLHVSYMGGEITHIEYAPQKSQKLNLFLAFGIFESIAQNIAKDRLDRIHCKSRH